MMKVFYSDASPYARKVRMAVVEKGLSDQVQFEVCAPYDKPADLVEANPVIKIPALVREDGSSLFDSAVICEYLDSLTPEPQLLPPAAGEERWAVLRLHALANGMTDATYLATMEGRRPDGEQSPAWVEKQRGKILSCCDALEASDLPDSAAPSLSTLALAAALGYVDLRHDDLGWRNGRPNLTAWMDKASQRPSFQSTIPAP